MFLQSNIVEFNLMNSGSSREMAQPNGVVVCNICTSQPVFYNKFWVLQKSVSQFSNFLTVEPYDGVSQRLHLLGDPTWLTRLRGSQKLRDY